MNTVTLEIIMGSCLHYDSLENNENTPLYGATLAMILAGQKDAKKRVFLFFSIYFITGMASKYGT